MSERFIYAFSPSLDNKDDNDLINNAKFGFSHTKENIDDCFRRRKHSHPNDVPSLVISSGKFEGDGDKEFFKWLIENYQSKFSFVQESDQPDSFKTDIGDVKNNDGGREIVETTVGEFKFLLNRIREYAKGESYIEAWQRTPRIPQKQFLDFGIAYYSDSLNAKRPLLCNAVPRFGKTTIALWLIRAMSWKNILVLTRCPGDTKKAWRDEASSPDVEFIDMLEQNIAVVRNPEKLFTITFVSFQDAQDLTKEKFTNIADIHYDIIILDEFDKGADTELAKTIRASFNYNHLLFMSGTPFKALASGDFTDANTFSFSYVDEQNIRDIEIAEGNGKKGDHFQCCPLRMKIVQLSPEFMNDTSQFDADEGFSFNKFLRVEDDKFVHEVAVRDFVKFLKTYPMPYSQQAHASGQYKQGDFKDHTKWDLPGIKECDAMKNLLEEDVYFGNYIIITAYDDNRGQGKNALNNVIENIGKAKRDGTKFGTITLSCGKLNRGVSIPEWGSVFMLSDISSPEEYAQIMMRTKTPRKGKEEVYVFDFNPYRALKLIYSWAKSSGNQNIQEAVIEYLRCLTPFILNETTWQVIKPEDIWNHFSFVMNKKDISNIFRDFEFNKEDVDEETIAAIMAMNGIKAKQADMSLSDSEGEKGKFAKVIQSAIKADFDDKSKPEPDIKELMKVVFEQIPNFISIVKGDSFSDLLDNATEKECRSMLGISLKQLKVFVTKQSQSSKIDNDARVKAIRIIKKSRDRR